MRNKSYLSFAVVTLSLGSMLLSFQNCAPQAAFESLEEASASRIPNGFPKEGGAAVSNAGLPAPAVATTPATTASGGNNTTPKTASGGNNTISQQQAVTSPPAPAEPGPRIFVQNDYPGSTSGLMKINVPEQYTSTFPYSYRLQSSGKYYWSSEKLFVSSDDHTLVKSSADFCISRSADACVSASEFERGTFGGLTAEGMVYLEIADFWNTDVMKYFGKYYLTVVVHGVKKKAIINHQPNLALPYGYYPDSRMTDRGYSTTAGKNVYMFFCERTKVYGLDDWISISSVGVSNEKTKSNCYYKVRDRY